MKYLKYILTVLVLLVLLGSYSFGITSDFKKIISKIGISQYNNQGYSVNEEIYNKYSKIIYSSPEKVIEGQEWIIKKDGKWSENEEKGEYKILGYDQNGKIVINNYFLKQVQENNNPLTWKYVNQEIQNNNLKQHTDFINQKLIYNGNKFNITINDIGLDKVQIISYPTWQNNGIIKIKRLEQDNSILEEILYTDPLLPNIDVQAIICAEEKKAHISLLNDTIELPIKYDIKLSNIENIKQIKKIKLDLYMNNIYVRKC